MTLTKQQNQTSVTTQMGTPAYDFKSCGCWGPSAPVSADGPQPERGLHVPREPGAEQRALVTRCEDCLPGGGCGCGCGYVCGTEGKGVWACAELLFPQDALKSKDVSLETKAKLTHTPVLPWTPCPGQTQRRPTGKTEASETVGGELWGALDRRQVSRRVPEQRK